MEGVYNLPLDYKLDDIDIFAWKGIKLPQHEIVVQQLNSFEWFHIYLPYMRQMLNFLDKLFPGVTFGEKSYLEYKDFIYVALTNKLFRKHYFGLLKKLKIIKGSIKKFLKNTGIDLLIDIFFSLYLFNTDGLKKKLKYRINQVFIQKNPISETSSMNAKNMGGLRIVDKIVRPPKRSKT